MKPDSLGQKLDQINISQGLHDILIKIFTPFDDNIQNNSYMDNIGQSVISVKEAILQFKTEGQLPEGLIHIDGLNDLTAFSALALGSSDIETITKTIGLTSEDIVILKEILIIIKQNQLTRMQASMET